MSLLVTSVVASALYAHTPPPTVEQLVERMHAPRRGITRYEAVIEYRATKGEARPLVHRVWQDGNRYRQDRLDQFDRDGRSRRTISCTNAPEPGLFFSASYGLVFNPAVAASMRPLADRIVLSGEERLRFEDLGATSEDLLNQGYQRGVRYYLDGITWDHRRVERVGWRGRAAYRLAAAGAARGWRVSFELTVLPGRGYAPVRARMASTRDGRTETDLCESEVTRVAGIWLPTAVVTTRFENDRLVSEAVQRATYARVNRPPDPRVFTLAGLDLIPGTLVSTADGLKQWDGRQLVPATGLVR